MAFDASRIYEYQIYPCYVVEQTAELRGIETCEEGEAEFWTVYARRHPNGEVEAMADCPTREIAELIALALTATTL